MLARVHSVQVAGLKADTIDVEVDVSRGLHSFSIVGLPDKAVEEARDRIRAAIKNSGIELPAQGSKKILVSLAPATIRKEGAFFDCAIALAYLRAQGALEFDPKGKLFAGELSLGGEVRPVPGALLAAQHARKQGFAEIYVPKENAEEAALVEGITVFPVSTLAELLLHLNTTSAGKRAITPHTRSAYIKSHTLHRHDFREIIGQESAKRGLEIAAAGGHNVLMFGPPGTGKTMLARAFPGILPRLTFDEILEVTGIHSVAGTAPGTIITEPPFRAPHHTASYVSVVGGGSSPKPGEITLAHRGVLFLDEFPGFDRRVVEALREPLEERTVSISRARGSFRFPAHAILIATMNPCPCGNKGHKTKECICPPGALLHYQRKLSGPIMDRIDVCLEVPAFEYAKAAAPEGETSADIHTRIERARDRQKERFTAVSIRTNAEMGPKEIKKYAELTPTLKATLDRSAEKLELSLRSYHKIIKLARTIADLAETDSIEEKHLMEALAYRPKTKN